MSFFLTGTDTEVGKTVTCAWLLLHYRYHYWKPIQSGMDNPDTEIVRKITDFHESFFFPPTYELQQPLSPHTSAKLDGIKIELSNFKLPRNNTKIVVEGAGGVLVPINGRKEFMVDIMAKLSLPILLVARSKLGTINHTLLTINELKRRNLPLKGIILCGEKNRDNKESIETCSGVPVVAELNLMKTIDKNTLLLNKPGGKLDEIFASAG
tara:strand:+ start:1053 stop:1682 length:630 start_codon:yes stop_codon:yes gene_type:complete